MKKHLLKLTKILVVFALMLNVFEPLMVLAAKPTTAEKGQIYNPQTDTVGDSATITEGSFTNPGDVQVQKIVSKTTTEGVYNVEFKVRGKKVQETSVRPVYAVVVMDTSGSMRNTAGNPKWTNAVNGAKTFASTLLQEIPTAQIALVTFAGDKYPNQAWDDAEVRREFASSNLNNVNFGSAEGGTNVEAGLREARILLSNTSIPSNAAKFVVLVGDGEPTFYYDDNGKTQGPGNGYSEESIQEAYGEANLIKTAGVDVYTLGYSVTPGGTAETVLKNIASKPENYFAASPEQVSAAFIAIATQISTFAAGVNPTIVDNAGSAFTITSGSGTLSLEGDITEEWKSVGSLQITIDGNSPTGWYPTNDGFTLSYTDYNNVNQTIDYNTNPEVYWIQNKYNYVINYYKDSISSSNFITKEEGEAFLGEEITADTTVHIPPGYKFVGEAPKMTIVETGNVLNVVYVKDTFGYKVEYYYDNVKNDNLTVTGSAEYGSTINTYTDKLIAGYELEKTENFPLTVSENENNNVIKVYYKKGQYNYTVNYYYDNVQDTTATENKTAYYLDVIETYEEKNKTGYKLSHVNGIPLTIGANPAENYINVYYVKNTFGYTVEYYYDGVIDTSKTESGTALFESQITTYTDKNITGYKLEKTENLPLTIGANPDNNVIKVYYVKNTYAYTVEYYYDGVINNSKTESGTALFGSQITTYIDKNVVGYKFDKTENLPLTITAVAANNVIKVYYVKNMIGYTVEYYYDGVINNSKTESGTALFGSQITTYTDKNIAGYKFDKTENLPLTITGVAANNVIKVYYVKDSFAYTVEYYYDGIINNSKTENGTALFGSQITGYTDKNITGYKLEKEENLPLTITEVAANNVIKIYYVKNTYGYTVEYYYDGVIDNSKTESGTALYNSKITTYTDKNITGYKLEKEEGLPLTITEVTANNVIKVYYIKDTFTYTVEYYYDGVINSSKTENGTALYNSKITTYTDKNIAGYKLDKEENLPLTITEVAANNVIRVYYVKDTFAYRIEYYYDNVIDSSKTETSSALYQDVISTYTDKNITGYRLDKTENLPLVVGNVENNNVIKVYYVKNTYQFKVFYFYDNLIDSSKTETSSASYQDVIDTYTDKNITGYKLDKEEGLPLTITEVAENNVIKVYYVKDTFGYTIEYYFDEVIDETLTENLTAIYGEEISTYPDKLIEGYILNKVIGCPLIVSEDPKKNVIQVHYVTYGQGTIEDPEPPHTEVVVSNNRSINTVYLYKKEEEEK